MHGPDEVPGVVLFKPGHHAAGGHNTVTHALKSIQNLDNFGLTLRSPNPKNKYYLPAKMECCIPQSSPCHREILADQTLSLSEDEPL